MQPPNATGKGHLANNIMHFARVLREAGIPVGSGAVLDGIDAALAGPLKTREDFYWTLHCVFVKRREHREIFDQAFHVFWKKPKMLEQLMQLMYAQIARKPDQTKKKAGFKRLAEAMFDQHDAPQQKRSETLEVDAQFTASALDVIRQKDFEQMSVEEQAAAQRAIQKLRTTRVLVASRRLKPAVEGRFSDIRRSMRKSLRTGGQLIELKKKDRVWREPPLVVLADVSGSCSAYSRMFLHFLHALVRERSRIHVFLFGTRLTNVTRELGRRDVDLSVERVSNAVKDWSGGTRIGATLHEFNYKWARRVLTQGAHVLLMTDGLDRENISQLEEEMQRLRRSSKRIVWLNPLLRFEGFQALAGGIRAMMPYVDEFRPVHSLDSLEDLARTLAAPRSAAHDPRQWLKPIVTE